MPRTNLTVPFPPLLSLTLPIFQKRFLTGEQACPPSTETSCSGTTPPLTGVRSLPRRFCTQARGWGDPWFDCLALAVRTGAWCLPAVGAGCGGCGIRARAPSLQRETQPPGESDPWGWTEEEGAGRSVRGAQRIFRGGELSMADPCASSVRAGVAGARACVCACPPSGSLRVSCTEVP